MNKEQLEKFYNKISNQPNYYQTAISIKEMLSDLCKYRALKIRGDFEKNKINVSHSLSNKDYYAPYVTIKGFKFKNIEFTIDIDIVCEEKNTTIFFVNTANTKNWKEDEDKCKILSDCLDNCIKEGKILKIDEKNHRLCSLEFLFPEEEEKLYNCIKSILTQLNQISNDKID